MEATAATTTTTMNASDQVGAAMAPGEDSMRFPLYMRIAGTLACMIIFTIGVTGNLLVPLVVIKTKYLRNSTNLFLINLSIADLLVLIVCMPTMIIELHSRPETWLLGEPMCKVSNYVETLAANGSISTILAISFERYYAICKPLKAGYKCTRLRAAIIICVVWILASILSSPIYMMAKSSQVVYETDKSMVYNCILETDTYWSKMYVFVSMFAFFCLPLLVLMLVYWLISRRLIRENVAMMDSSTTRNHLIDSRTNIAHPSSHHAHLTGGANCHHQRGSNVLQFRRPDHKRASSSSTSATLSSLFNSIRHYNYHGQNATGQDDTCGSSTHKGKHRFGSVLMTQSSATTKISAQVSADHASDIKGGHRRPLVVGKAMSLDYGGSRVSGGTTDNGNHAAAAGPMRAVQAADDGQPCWPGNSEIFHSRANTDSSNADVTTTATTSTTDADIQTNCRQGSSSSSPASMARKASLPGWIFSSHLSELMGQLLGISSRLKATGFDHTINQDKTTDNSKSESAFKGDITTGGRHSRRVSAADVSMPTATFCDSVLINGHLPCTGKTNVGISEKEELSKPHSDHDQDQSHLPLMQATFSSCGGGAGHRSLDSKDIDRSSNQNINRVIKADQSTTDTTNDQPHRRGRGVAGRAGRSETRRRTKRSLESKRQKQCRQDSGDEPRSRFKWVKGFSVSSSTGSTYTNSTFLPSETGSISPSLHNSSSRQHSTPSPPRPVGTDTHRATSTSPETGVELGYPYQSPFDGGGHRGNSRSCSPEKLPSSDRKKVAHFDEVVDVGEIDLTLRHPPRLTNPESCSDPAANTGDSDRSLSPSGSLSNEPAAMSSATKSSWLESLAQCEQHDTHQRSLHRSLVQSRQLCQHDEEGQTDAALLGSKYEGRQDKRTSATYIYGECNDGVDVRTFETDSGSRLNLEVIDACHDSTSHVARAIDSGIDATGIVKSNTTTARARVVRSMTEEHAHQRANYIDELERIRLFPIDAGLTPLQHQCDLNLSSASRAPARHSIVNAHRHINKVNLIAMAHNISDNLHFKRHKQRSGSHPVVSHHMQVHNECNGAAHTEFLTVRDVSKRQQMDSRRQVVAMLAFVVACFFLLFLPYRVFTIWLILSTEEQVQSLGMETYYNIVYFARTLIYLHSAINPIAYNLISTKFRRAFMSILLCRGPATRRNFTADPHRFFPYDSKGQLNANQNRSTGTANANNSGSKGPRSPRDLTK